MTLEDAIREIKSELKEWENAYEIQTEELKNADQGNYKEPESCESVKSYLRWKIQKTVGNINGLETALQILEKVQ